MPPVREIAAAWPPPGRPKSRPWRTQRGVTARELRDRWLEHVNADASALLGEAKYDVGRRISRTGTGSLARGEMPALPAPRRGAA